MKVWALQGKVVTAGACVAYVIAIAIATKIKVVWPFALFLLLAGLSGMVGWGIYRDDRPDDPDPEHRTAVQSPGPGVPRTCDNPATPATRAPASLIGINAFADGLGDGDCRPRPSRGRAVIGISRDRGSEAGSPHQKRQIGQDK